MSRRENFVELTHFQPMFLRFSDVFRECRSGTLVGSGLKNSRRYSKAKSQAQVWTQYTKIVIFRFILCNIFLETKQALRDIFKF